MKIVVDKFLLDSAKDESHAIMTDFPEEEVSVDVETEIDWSETNTN